MTTRTDQDETIRLSVPARAAFAQVARLTVAAVAARADFGYDDVEDLRIAVGELCGLLVDDRADARLTVICRIDDEGIYVEASRAPGDSAVEVPDLSRQILEAVTDGFTADADAARLTIHKTRRG